VRWSAELEFLARLARLAPTAGDHERARALASGGLDWPRVLRLAAHHGVAPLVHANLLQTSRWTPPADVLGRLRELRRGVAHTNLALYAEWLELCRVFEDAGIPALTLKGFHTSLDLYGDLGRRVVGDLDFLVARSDIRAALAVLGASGYHLVPEWGLAVRHVGLNHVLDCTNEMMLANEIGAVVDLHWEAGPAGAAPPAPELFADARPFAVGEQTVLVPSRGAAISLLLLHGHRSAWNRLRWLVDMAEALDVLSAEEYADVERRLHAVSPHPALRNAIWLIEDIWQRRTVETNSSRARAPGSLSLAHARQSLECEQDSQHVYDFWRPLRRARDRAGRESSLPAALRAALTPNYFDWAWADVPRPLRFGYYGVRPVRIALQALGVVRGRATTSAPAGAFPAGAFPATDGTETPFTIVTAIYDNGRESLIGGRGYGVETYLPSLINIANLGAPIVIFAPPKDVGRITQVVRPHFARFRVVPARLSEFEHYDRLLAWKQEYVGSLVANDRNELLCFQKSYWVQRAIALRPFGHDSYFWIDSGLTHQGIFPRRVGGVELRVTFPPSHYYPRNRANIFRPALGAALAAAASRGRVVFCALPFARNAAEYEQVAADEFGNQPEQTRIIDHLVGGVWGGHRDDLRAVHHLYARLLERFIRERVYTLEEQVFSALYASFPDRFTVLRFGTWYFHSPGEPCSYLASDGDSFYKIFTRLLHDCGATSSRVTPDPSHRAGAGAA